jgi:hypothetical protein
MGWSCASLSRHVWQLQTMQTHNQTKTLDSIHCNFIQKYRNIFKTETFMNYSHIFVIPAVISATL